METRSIYTVYNHTCRITIGGVDCILDISITTRHPKELLEGMAAAGYFVWTERMMEPADRLLMLNFGDAAMAAIKVINPADKQQHHVYHSFISTHDHRLNLSEDPASLAALILAEVDCLEGRLALERVMAYEVEIIAGEYIFDCKMEMQTPYNEAIQNAVYQAYVKWMDTHYPSAELRASASVGFWPKERHRVAFRC